MTGTLTPWLSHSMVAGYQRWPSQERAPGRSSSAFSNLALQVMRWQSQCILFTGGESRRLAHIQEGRTDGKSSKGFVDIFLHYHTYLNSSLIRKQNITNTQTLPSYHYLLPQGWPLSWFLTAYVSIDYFCTLCKWNHIIMYFSCLAFFF